MSSITSYKTTAFKESQKFLVIDPSTQSPSLVLGSDLVSYITPMLNYVRADSTRLSAENTDYDVGTLVQTSGATSPGDNFAATYLVVEGGSGDFPMLNGNDLLVIKGDEFLREQLASSDVGDGSDLVAHTGTSDTVTEALDKRTIYVGSVAELEALPTPASGQEALVSGVPFKYNGAAWIPSQGYVTLEIYGATGTGTETTEVQAALDSGYEIRGSGTYTVGHIIPPANCSVLGKKGSPIVFKLAADGKLCTFQNANISFENVVFDCDNITLSEEYPVSIAVGTDSPTLKNVKFRNYRGGATGSEIQQCYGLLVEMEGVKDFHFENLRFDEISNLGDGVETFNGFAGGIFFYNTAGTAIAEADVSRGTIDGVYLDSIYTRYQAGTLPADKQADNDADGIRFFSSTTIKSADIKIRNVYAKSVGKRVIKITRVSGMDILGVYCDGSQPIDPEVSMDSIIKDGGDFGNSIAHVRGYFGAYYCQDAIQTQDVDGSIINDVIVDDCNYLVGESGTSKNRTITNIRALVHGGLRLDNLSAISNSTTFVDNAYLLFDRNGRNASNTNRRGCSFRNEDNLKLGKIYIKNGQFSAILVNELSYDSVTVDWDNTTDPTTTGMGAAPISEINVTNLLMGKMSVNVTDSLANYLTSPGTGVTTIRATDSAEGGATTVRSKNNVPVAIIRGTDGNFGDFTTFSDVSFDIGQQDGDPISNSRIGRIALMNPTAKIRWVRTVTNVVIGQVYKPNSDGIGIFIESSPTLTSNYVERVFWDPNGAASLGTPAGVTVLDTQTLA